MKIALISLQQESNSLSPIISRLSDFDTAYGEDMLEKIHIVDITEAAEVEIVPIFYAHALPGGPLKKEDFLSMVNYIIESIPIDIDGVWLYLHGAMYVCEIGSGETYLLERLREKIGFKIPISLGLDFHANNTDRITELANVITGFRTVPHTDQIETERRAVRLLLDCIKGSCLPKPQLERVNVIIPGDAVQTAHNPLKKLMESAKELEEIPGMMSVQIFGGQPWVDSPYTGPTIVVTHSTDAKMAKSYAEKLAAEYYDMRHDFQFQTETAEPSEGIIRAMNSSSYPIFLSDSGDNPTAGAVGDNAFLLSKLMEAKAEGVLVAGIADATACAKCYQTNLGAEITVKIGGELDKRSQSVEITGTLIHRGEILGYTGTPAGKTATIAMNGITVVISEQRVAFTNSEIFSSIDLDIGTYKIIVVKLGYLFPELEKMAKCSILLFTPGASTERLEEMGHTQIRRPMFPLDDNFILS